MALSQDEQRVLAEIERRLVAEDPGLAASLTSFRRPGPAAVLRSPRARILGSLFTVMLVAMISLMVYAMIPFRAHGPRVPGGRSVPAREQTALTASGSPSPFTISAAPGSSAVAKAKTSVGAAGPARSARGASSRTTAIAPDAKAAKAKTSGSGHT
jgi:hypothetical protein